MPNGLGRNKVSRSYQHFMAHVTVLIPYDTDVTQGKSATFNQ